MKDTADDTTPAHCRIHNQGQNVDNKTREGKRYAEKGRLYAHRVSGLEEVIDTDVGDRRSIVLCLFLGLFGA